MATKKPQDNAPVDRGPGYEQRDANIGALVQFAFWMAVVLAVTLIAMRWSFDYFKKVTPLGPPASPIAGIATREIPPSPLLQAHPHQELVDYCTTQEQKVNTFGWVDRQSGVVRIPVDRAMDLILTRGLAARAAGDEPPTTAPLSAVVPGVPGGGDVQGQCGYLTEPPPPGPASESAESKP